MKLTTLALSSTFAMALTSASVWALTPPGERGATKTTRGSGSDPADVAKPAGDGGGGLGGWLSGSDERGATFSNGGNISVEGRIGHASLDAARGGETYLMVTLQPAADAVASTTAPVNLSIVVDRSRSMTGQRMVNALDAARGMVRRLREGDTVSVVAYNSSTDVLVPATTIDERSRGDVLFSLRGVEARGHTCISCGIEAGMASMERRTGTVNRMLLLSDGEANFGVRDEEGFRRIAEQARRSDIAISSVGVDVDYNERVLLSLAQGSNGRHHFVDDTSSLQRIFDDELSSLQATVANDARVELDLAPGVQVLEVLDRSFTRDGNRVVVPFGALAVGDTKTLLVRVRIGAGEVGTRTIASVRTVFDDLTSGRRSDSTSTLVATMTNDAAAVAAELDPVVEARVARSETAASLARANELFSSGRLEEANAEIDANRGRIKRRKARADEKASGALKDALGGDFDKQLQSLDSAERGFSQAAAESPAPAAAPQSRTGKAQVRSNAGLLDDLLQ